MKPQPFDLFLAKFLPVNIVLFSIAGVLSLIVAICYWRPSAAIGAAVSFATVWFCKWWLDMVKVILR